MKGVTGPGLINLDFADVRAVMDEMGKAMMGTGEAEGEDRAIQAAEKAIANPLLDEISLKGAKGVLINITGGDDLTLFELDEAANRIREEVDADANIIVGSTMETAMDGKMRVSVVATGIDAEARTAPVPQHHETVAAPAPQPAQAFEAQPMAAADGAYVEEPGLFEEMPAAPAQTDDGLPPPAYQPEPEQQYATSFERPAPGTPTREALERLERVTGRARGSMSNHVPGEAAYAASRPAAQSPGPEQERPKFGINTLINKMSGAAPTAAEQARQQPPVNRVEPEMPDDQERIEIPAFLRRQAN